MILHFFLFIIIRQTLFFFFLMIRRPPRSTLFPTRRSSDLVEATVTGAEAGIPKSSPRRSPGISVAAATRRIMTTSVPALSPRSEEHTSELQSQSNLVCRLLLEKKKTYSLIYYNTQANTIVV